MYRATPLSGLIALLLASGPIAATAETGPGIACIASGYDVIIRNESEVPVAAGTQIDWRVAFTRTTGTHTLRAALEPGARVNLSGAMGSDFLVSDRPCELEIVDDPENG